MNLTHMYRSVLKKCALINSAIIVGALATAISIMSNDAYAGNCTQVGNDVYCDSIADTQWESKFIPYAKSSTISKIIFVGNSVLKHTLEINNDISSDIINAPIDIGNGSASISLSFGSIDQTSSVLVPFIYSDFVVKTNASLWIYGNGNNFTTVKMQSLTNNGGTVTLNDSSTELDANLLSNTGLFMLSGGKLVINSDIKNSDSGTFTFNSGTITTSAIENTGTFEWNAGTINTSSITNSGTFTINSQNIASIDVDFNLIGGNLIIDNQSAPGDLNNTSNFNWTGGSITATSITNNGTFQIVEGNEVTSQYSISLITNNEIFKIDNSDADLKFGELTNSSTGTFYINNGTITATSITNNGTFQIVEGINPTLTLSISVVSITNNKNFTIDNSDADLSIESFKNNANTSVFSLNDGIITFYPNNTEEQYRINNKGIFNVKGGSLYLGNLDTSSILNDTGAYFNWLGGTLDKVDSITNNGIFKIEDIFWTDWKFIY